MAELASSPTGASIDVRGYRDRIVHLHEQVETDEDRGFLLEAFFSLMAFVERAAASQGQDASRIRGLRDADYRLMLIKEAQLDGNIDPDLLARVTSREVTAGRLGPDDDFHDLATAASAVMGKGQRSPGSPKSIWGRLFDRD
jgi:hypothetical protein